MASLLLPGLAIAVRVDLRQMPPTGHRRILANA
jgi:hypothetical protein